MYSLVYVTQGFDPEDGTALGGNCVEERFASIAAARQASDQYAPAARRMWGPGVLTVMDDVTGCPVLPGQDDRAAATRPAFSDN